MRADHRPIFVLALLVVGCGSDGSDPVAGEEYLGMTADQIMFDVEHYVTSRGIRRALLIADTAFLYEDSARLDIRQVDLTLFDDQGEATAELTAARGELDTRTEAMVARGDVVLITREGDRRIETEELHFDPDADRIWSDVATTLHEEGTVVRGEGFTSDAQLRNIQVQRPTGRFEGLKVEF